MLRKNEVIIETLGSDKWRIELVAWTKKNEVLMQDETLVKSLLEVIGSPKLESGHFSITNKNYAIEDAIDKLLELARKGEVK